MAGEGDALDRIAHRLDELRIFNRFLNVKVPYHTHYMDTVKEDLCHALRGLSSTAATIPLFSTVTADGLLTAAMDTRDPKPSSDPSSSDRNSGSAPRPTASIRPSPVVRCWRRLR
ncbi:hypothetical protein [Mycobacterium malmoense]|uniref:hypothetical protein n=1 Tax=Mycobacterium malmoense TaxID=1780 RepID=UPI003F88324E